MTDLLILGITACALIGVALLIPLAAELWNAWEDRRDAQHRREVRERLYRAELARHAPRYRRGR